MRPFESSHVGVDKAAVEVVVPGLVVVELVGVEAAPVDVEVNAEVVVLAEVKLVVLEVVEALVVDVVLLVEVDMDELLAYSVVAGTTAAFFV